MQNNENQPIVDIQVLKEKVSDFKQSVQENAAVIIVVLLAVIALFTFIRMVADIKRTREMKRLRYGCDCDCDDYDGELDFDYMDRGNL
jgi:hypothetical protein